MMLACRPAKRSGLAAGAAVEEHQSWPIPRAASSAAFSTVCGLLCSAQAVVPILQFEIEQGLCSVSVVEQSVVPQRRLRNLQTSQAVQLPCPDLGVCDVVLVSCRR